MLLFSRIQSYYHAVGIELDLGPLPHRPLLARSLVIVPVGSISKLTEHARRHLHHPLPAHHTIDPAVRLRYRRTGG